MASPVHHLINYLAYLSSSALSYSTAKCYMSGISHQVQLQGLQDNSKSFIIKKMLEGLRRSKPSKDIRCPITLTLLNQIVSVLPAVCNNSYEATLFATAFQLAFFALLRVGELTVSISQNASRVIAPNDIHFNSDSSVNIFIKGSETDQLGKGASVHIPYNIETKALVSALHLYISKRPSVSGPFFCHMDGSPLTSYQFSSLLQKSLKFIGIDSSTFKSHSFRIGGATHMYLHCVLGSSEQEIMSKGHWSSSAVKSYIRM